MKHETDLLKLIQQAPGRYDSTCEFVRELTQARVAIVIVLEGNQGNGFSVCIKSETPVTDCNMLPGILRQVASEIEKQQPTNPT